MNRIRTGRQYAVGSRQRSNARRSLSPVHYSPTTTHCSLPTRRGFTLVELLMVVTIIAMLAGFMMGALARTREAAREAKTKATIAKLNDIIMRKYESYFTRRIPIPTGDKSPRVAARLRLDAIRDIMRLEMPERWTDIIDDPVSLPKRPGLSMMYKQKYDSMAPGTPVGADYGPAECLYLTVMSIPGAREQFSQDEIGDVNGDGWPEFLDGWGQPIMWLRWAPGFTPWSDIQYDPYGNTDPKTSTLPAAEKAKLEQLYHDPFDPRNLEPAAFRLTPIIYSGAGHRLADGTPDYGLDLDKNYHYAAKGSPYANMNIGNLVGALPMHNHHMEQK